MTMSAAPVHAATGRVLEHRPQRDLIAVHIGNDAMSHAGKRNPLGTPVI
jgi:hypothetical protein